MTTYTPGTIHPTNKTDYANYHDYARMWRIKLQTLELQAKTFLHDKDERTWIPKLLSSLTEINALASSGLFDVPQALAAVKSVSHAECVTGAIWYENLTVTLAAIFGSVKNADIGRIEK